MPKPAAPAADTGVYVSIAVGGQPLTRSFASSGTFTSFNETGRYEVNHRHRRREHVRHRRRLSVHEARRRRRERVERAIRVRRLGGRVDSRPRVLRSIHSTEPADDKGLSSLRSASTCSSPTPVPVADRFDVAVSGGPTIIKTTLDAGSIAVTPNTQQVRLSSDRQSKTSAKSWQRSASISRIA